MICPLCKKSVSETMKGELRVHGPKIDRCAGSGMTPAMVKAYAESLEDPESAAETPSAALLGDEIDTPEANRIPLMPVAHLIPVTKAQLGENEPTPASADPTNWVPKDPELAAKWNGIKDQIAAARAKGDAEEQTAALNGTLVAGPAIEVPEPTFLGGLSEDRKPCPGNCGTTILPERDMCNQCTADDKVIDSEGVVHLSSCAALQNIHLACSCGAVPWDHNQAEAQADAENCSRCNMDRHQCPGCGAPLAHGVEVCDPCNQENVEREIAGAPTREEEATPSQLQVPPSLGVGAKPEAPESSGISSGPLPAESADQPATEPLYLPAQPKQLARPPAVPCFTGEQRLESLNATVVLGKREAIGACIEMLRRTSTLACDIETEGLGLLARNIKTVIFSDGDIAALLDPRDPDQHKVIRWVLAQAQQLIFHNSPYDVPNMAVNGLFDVDWCAKVTDTLLYGKLAEPANLVSKALAECANRYLGLTYDKSGMRTSAKAVGINSDKEMYRKFDLDRPVYARGAGHDAIVTARLLQPIRKAALTRLMTGHPFEDWGVKGSEALRLLEREQILNRMSLRRSAVRGLRVDLEYLDQFNARFGQQIHTWEAKLAEFSIRPTNAQDLVKWLDGQGLIPEGYPRTGKTKQLSGAKDHLELLGHPVAKLFVAHKEAVHVLHDYLEKVRDMAVLSADGHYRVFPVIKYFGATTGRASIGEPPLHQFPELARGVILADPGRGLTSIDWSQIEPVVIANLSGQTDVLEGYESGREDFYDTLARVTGLPRKRNKTQLLGTLYGQGKKLTAAKLGVSLEEADEIKAAVFAPMPKVLQQTYTLRSIGEQYEMIPTVSGRIIPVPSGFYTDPDTGEKRWSVQTHKAVNYHVQGSAYDVLAESMVECEDLGYGDAIYLHMHDEIVTDTEASRDIQQIMARPPARLVHHSGRSPILRTDLKDLGERWNVA